MKINCTLLGDGNACLAGLYAGQCGIGVAIRCRDRKPSDAGESAILGRSMPSAAVARAQPGAVAADEVDICAERIREEWRGEWRAKLEAAVIRRVGGRAVLPRALYEEAMQEGRG